MKKFENVLMICAALSACFSIILCALSGQPWWWQLNTILWIFVAFMKNELIKKYEESINKK